MQYFLRRVTTTTTPAKKRKKEKKRIKKRKSSFDPSHPTIQLATPFFVFPCNKSKALTDSPPLNSTEETDGKSKFTFMKILTKAKRHSVYYGVLSLHFQPLVSYLERQYILRTCSNPRKEHPGTKSSELEGAGSDTAHAKYLSLFRRVPQKYLTLNLCLET